MKKITDGLFRLKKDGTNLKNEKFFFSKKKKMTTSKQIIDKFLISLEEMSADFYKKDKMWELILTFEYMKQPMLISNTAINRFLETLDEMSGNFYQKEQMLKMINDLDVKNE